jgi:hypothetical protein
MGRDPVGQPASRSMGFSKWAVLIGRTGFVYTISSLPDPTLMFLNCHSEVSESRVGKTKKTEKTSRDKTIEGCHRRDAATAPCLSVKRAFPRRQLRSSRRSHHYYSLTHYAQTAHNGAMAAPTEHQVCLILFAKNTGLKTRAGYHRRDAATAVRTSSRSARFERVPIANRQALSLHASRAPALRAFLGGLSIIVTQFLLLVVGNHARSASRTSPSPYPPYPASAAGHGRRRVGSARD